MNKEFDYITNLYCRMNVTVLAENKEEAERILKDTINDITDEKFKSFFSECTQLEITDTSISKNFYSLDRDKGER